MTPDRGALGLIRLDPTLGHEQRGFRPAVVVSDTSLAQSQRFPMLCVVPVTGTSCSGDLYPRLDPGQSGLRSTSYALVDQLRSVDKKRVRRILGQISDMEMAAVVRGIRLYLGMDG